MPTIQQVTETIEQLFKAHKWNFIPDKDTGSLRTAFKLGHKRIPEIRLLVSFAGTEPGKTDANAECQGLRVIASCNIKAEEEKLADVAEYITRVNFGLYNGNFELDYTDGEVRYKTYVNCRGQLPEQTVLEDALHAPIFLFQRYGDGLLKVLSNRRTPEKAVQEAERS